MIEFENGVGLVKTEKSYKIIKYKNEKCLYICESIKLKGNFAETFELNDFPVDAQVNHNKLFFHY
jgi:hypothetical protein